ncbi:MAG: 2-amino-4-hydroxy-6-hydroxymethyldihydropteridine diphosphokinase [Dehalococcoidia bacterium]
MTSLDLTNDPAAICLGLGSNLGDRMGNLGLAVERLSGKLFIKKLSSVYETDPVGYEEQPLFLNAVVSAETELAPLELLKFIKGIESDMGREDSFRNAPRVIDIDILFYGDLVIQTPDITIPHAGAAKRTFVLVPLVEVCSQLIHPVSQRSISDLLAEAGGLDRVRLVGGFELEGSGPVALAGGNMYEVSVRQHFDAAHYLKGYGGRCEGLHGHRFEVVVAVESEKLNDIGIAFDFTELKGHLSEILKGFDHVCLNEISPFDGVNPSSENIAATIHQELVERLIGVVISRVEVWESPESRVVYTP